MLCFRRRFAAPGTNKTVHSCRFTGQLVRGKRRMAVMANGDFNLFNLPTAGGGSICHNSVSNVSMVRVTVPCSGHSDMTGETVVFLGFTLGYVRRTVRRSCSVTFTAAAPLATNVPTV